MSIEPEKLDPVLALLKAKQAPQPSAAFFDQMSHRIREGIQHPPPRAHTWWQRVAMDIDLKACLAGIVVCGLLVFGLLYAMKLDTQPPRYPSLIVTQERPDRIAPPTVLIAPSPRVSSPADRPETLPSSHAHVLMQTPSNSLFDALESSSTTPVNYGRTKPKP